MHIFFTISDNFFCEDLWRAQPNTFVDKTRRHTGPAQDIRRQTLCNT
jgi:hypothetical protein